MYFWQLALLCQLGLVRPQLWTDVRETRTQQADGHQGQGFWGQLARSKNDKGYGISSRGPQYSMEGRHSASAYNIESDKSYSTNKYNSPDIDPRIQIQTPTRRIDYDDYSEYYYYDDYDYEDDIAIDRRQGEISRQELLLDLLQNNKKETKEKVGKSSAVNTIAVLDMINNLQHEIIEINTEIENENKKIEQLRSKQINANDDEFEEPVRNAAKVSTEETVKELTLQKEDTTMKKVMAQMMLMKQIQKKKAENKQLELALGKLSERRKLIGAALKKQKQIANEKRLDAQKELQRQKQLMKEKEQMILKLKAEEDLRDLQLEKDRGKGSTEKTKQLLLLSQLKKNNPKLGKLQLLEAHKSLVDQSNERILAKIEELKLQREREAVDEQEKLLEDQTKALAALKKMKSDRLRKQKNNSQAQRASLLLELQNKINQKKKSEKLKLSQPSKSTSSLLSLSDQEKRQVISWLDLERNAPILQKTDKAIAAKLSGRTAALTLGGSGLNLPSSSRVKSAAQVLSEGDLSDEEIDAILGIDEGLNGDEILFEEPGVIALDDPTILDLDDDALLFDDYEYYDDFGDDDYEEVIYEYEYEDGETPEILVEYEYVDEEPPPTMPPPQPAQPKPKYKPHYPPPYYPKHTPSYHGNLHGHRIPQYHSKPHHYEPKHHYQPKKQYYPYRYKSQHTHTGPQFLEEVSGLLQQAENSPPHITLSGSLRSALLKDVGHQARTELHTGPGGRLNTKVSFGHHSQPNHPPRRGHHAPPPPPPPAPVPNTFSNLMGATRHGVVEDRRPNNNGRGATFSQLMGDLLVGKPRIPGVTK